MSDLDFCKTRLEEIVDHTASPAKLLVKVQEFVAHRMPEEAADRGDLKAWAENELTKLEQRTPGGGVAQIGTAPLAKTGRRMLERGIAVDIFGDGASILMTRGFGRTSNVWYAQREVLARSFRVICPDLEGSGRSPLKGELSIDGFVADMAALLDTLNISSAHVVGYSLGTMVCQHPAVNYRAS